MSKTTVTVCAFIVGTCCGFLLNNRVPIVSASPLNPQASVPQKPQRSTISANAFGGDGEGVHIEGAIPMFRALETTPIFTDVTIFNTKQSLDGLECHNCNFNDADLRYSGGAFNLENVKFTGTIRLVLDGAAANTVAFLDLMKRISPGAPVVSPAPQTPIKKKAITKRPSTPISFTPPFIGPIRVSCPVAKIRHYTDTFCVPSILIRYEEPGGWVPLSAGAWTLHRQSQRRREIPPCAGRPSRRSEMGRKSVGLLRSE
jgi:hypothetical protein